jgi:Right handed beta helix region
MEVFPMKAKLFWVLSLTLVFQSLSLSLLGQSLGLVEVRRAEPIITVGGPEADIPGFTSGAIQLALDGLRTRGGGTVKLGPGVYEIIGPVRVPGNTSLVGSGKATILRKGVGFQTRFLVDADWGMLKAVVEDSRGFKIGMGIQLFDDAHNQGWDVTTAVISDIQDNVIYFDTPAVNDYLSSLNGTITNGCSIVEAVGAENVRIADLVVEGRKSDNFSINGCRGGGIYIHKSKNCLVDNVEVREFNGDSFSWQITENVTLRGCEASSGDGLGFHPGTGSDRSLMENCISHDNKGDGIFLCWRVQNGVFRNNRIYSNGENGISIGHKDTDNLFENNHIYENGHHGVLFREENEQNGGNRNTFTHNIVENNGIEQESNGFSIGGETRDIIIRQNIIRSTGKGRQTTAILIGRKSSNITTSDNRISGSREIVREQ